MTVRASLTKAVGTSTGVPAQYAEEVEGAQRRRDGFFLC